MATIVNDSPSPVNRQTFDQNVQLGVVKGLIFCDIDFQFDTYSDVNETQVNTDIAARSLHPVMGVHSIEPTTPDISVDASDTGEEIVANDPQRRYRYMFANNEQNLRAIRAYSNKRLAYFLVYSSGSIVGRSEDGTAIKGFSLNSIYAEKSTDTAADSVEKGVLRIEERDYKERENQRKIIPDTTWASSIDGIVTVNAPDAVVAANAFTALITAQDDIKLDNSDGSVRTQPISGLTAAEIEVTDQDGTVITGDDLTVTESSSTPGEYTITDAQGTPSLATGTYKVIPSGTALFASNVGDLTSS